MTVVDFSQETIAVSSDWHIFHSLNKFWGRPDKVIEAITAAVQKGSIQRLLLNGDTFENKVPQGFYVISEENYHLLMEQSVQFMEKLLKACPQLKIDYIFGNHDDSAELKVALEKMNEPRLALHDVWLKAGDTFIFHGDSRKSRIDFENNRREFYTFADRLEQMQKDGLTPPKPADEEDYLKRKDFDPTKGLEYADQGIAEIVATLEGNRMLSGIKHVVLGDSHKVKFKHEVVTPAGNKVSVYNTGCTFHKAKNYVLQIRFGRDGNAEKIGHLSSYSLSNVATSRSLS